MKELAFQLNNRFLGKSPEEVLDYFLRIPGTNCTGFEFEYRRSGVDRLDL